jgi:aspartate/methionine/tyrosine aminotransferase
MVDDAYVGFWYDASVMHESLFGMLVECHPNVVPVKIDGATKEEYAWGLRVGFLTFGLPEKVMQGIEGKLSGLIRANTSGAAQISQTLILEAMKAQGYAKQKKRNYEILKGRALKVKEVASDSQYAKLWEVYPSHAGYFTCLRLKSGNAEVVRQRLLDEHGIGTIALGETELRVAYSCLEESDIETVFAVIAQVIEGL